MSAATLVPGANSPPGQDLTMPTHSMPLTSAISAHSPLRMCSSAWLRPNALTWITAWPAFGSGCGISRMTSTSGPPNPVLRIARIRPSSPVSSRPGYHLIHGPGAGLTSLLPFALLSRGTGRAHHVLLQQVDRYGQENHVLHQESHVAFHRREAGRRVPAVRHEWDDADRGDERADREDGPEDARLGVPEPPGQERRGQPFRNPEEVGRPVAAEHRVHPERQRAIA